MSGRNLEGKAWDTLSENLKITMMDLARQPDNLRTLTKEMTRRVGELSLNDLIRDVKDIQELNK